MSALYLQLRIKAVIRETEDTFTYQLENTTPDPVIYQAGQFLTFVIQLHGTEYRRSYSLSSTPGIDADLAVTVRKKENGEISRHILRHWQPGDIVTSLPPSGRFTLGTPATTPRDILLMAAGSGITPVFSLLKQLLKDEPTARITLIYSNPARDRAIFYDALQNLQEQHPQQLTILWLFSSEISSEHPYRRLSNILLEPLVKERLIHDTGTAQFFVCGPPDYMRMILLTLTFMGFREDQLHKENFVVNTDTRIARTPPPTDGSLKAVTLRLHGQEHRLQIPGNENILHHALDKGIHLPYSCKGGVCGSCTARCSSGKVWMRINEVLTDKEVNEGLILTCVSYAVSDAVIIEL